MAGDYNFMGKGNFYEELIRVPTIVVPPGGSDIDRPRNAPNAARIDTKKTRYTNDARKRFPASHSGPSRDRQ